MRLSACDKTIAHSSFLVGSLGLILSFKKEFPSRAEEIDRQAEPWRVEKEEMAAGKKKLEGRWLNPEEWEKEKGTRERAAREAFLAKLEIPEAPPVLIGQGILLTTAGVTLLAAFLGASFLFHGISAQSFIALPPQASYIILPHISLPFSSVYFPWS